MRSTSARFARCDCLFGLRRTVAIDSILVHCFAWGQRRLGGDAIWLACGDLASSGQFVAGRTIHVGGWVPDLVGRRPDHELGDDPLELVTDAVRALELLATPMRYNLKMTSSRQQVQCHGCHHGGSS